MATEDADQAERTPRDRDVLIDQRIAVLEAKRGPVETDLADWALQALRNERRLRLHLKQLLVRAKIDAEDIEQRLAEMR